jgi:hypothetical protein
LSALWSFSYSARNFSRLRSPTNSERTWNGTKANSSHITKTMISKFLTHFVLSFKRFVLEHELQFKVSLQHTKQLVLFTKCYKYCSISSSIFLQKLTPKRGIQTGIVLVQT